MRLKSTDFKDRGGTLDKAILKVLLEAREPLTLDEMRRRIRPGAKGKAAKSYAKAIREAINGRPDSKAPGLLAKNYVVQRTKESGGKTSTAYEISDDGIGTLLEESIKGVGFRLVERVIENNNLLADLFEISKRTGVVADWVIEEEFASLFPASEAMLHTAYEKTKELPRYLAWLRQHHPLVKEKDAFDVSLLVEAKVLDEVQEKFPFAYRCILKKSGSKVFQ